MAAADPITYWHEWPSNFSGGQTVNGIGKLFQYANTSVGDSLGAIILFATFIISFIVLKANSFEKAFAASAFVTLLISVFLLRLQMIALPIVMMLAIATVLATVLVRGEAQRGL